MSEWLTNLGTWLTILKYLGLFLAAGSSIWGTVNELTITAAHGRKRLTPAGGVAIALTIFGLVISIVSEDLQRRQASSVHAEQVAAEAKRTNEIIIAGQPLTSLSLHWRFASANPSLWQTMKKGQDEIRKNLESGSSGRSPDVPFEVKEYDAALLPLVSYVARIGNGRKAGKSPETNQAEDGADNSVIVLVPLDESQNAILSFGDIGTDVSWYQEGDGAAISSGFAKASEQERRYGNSTPRVTASLAANRNGGLSSYAVDWDLDPITLTNAIDRRNATIQPAARLPRLLKVAILYDFSELPFQKNNFGLPYPTNLWRAYEGYRTPVSFGRELKNVTLTVEVNSFQEMKDSYVLKGMYELGLTDDYGDELDTRCTILEFEAQGEVLGE